MTNFLIKYQIIFAALVFIAFTYIGLTKLFWLDELFTLQVIQNETTYSIIKKFYSGADTNAPLYFILINYFITVFGDSEVALKSFGLICGIISIIVLFRLLKHLSLSTFSICFLLLFFIVAQGFGTYSLVEFRTYPLYLLFSLLYMFIYIKTNTKADTKLNFILAFMTAILLYTHYFSVFLILSVLITELISHRRTKILLSIMIGIVLFLPWFTAIITQFEIGHGRVHQSIPEYTSYFSLFLFLIGRGGIAIFVLLLLFYAFWKAQRPNKFLLVFGIIMMVVPLINILMSIHGLSVHSHRYFIYILLAPILVLSAMFPKMEILPNSIKMALVIFISLFSANRLNYYYHTTLNEKSRITEILNFQANKNLPLICESPHNQYPLNYYSRDKKVFFILDSLSAFSDGNIKNAPYDYLLLKNYKRFYPMQNFIDYDEFLNRHYHFLLYDEADRMFYEKRFRDNDNYQKISLGNNLYLINKKK